MNDAGDESDYTGSHKKGLHQFFCDVVCRQMAALAVLASIGGLVLGWHFEWLQLTRK